METQILESNPFPDSRSTSTSHNGDFNFNDRFNVALISDRRGLLASCSLKGDPKVKIETSIPLSHTENATQELHLRIQDRAKVMPTQNIHMSFPRHYQMPLGPIKLIKD